MSFPNLIFILNCLWLSMELNILEYISKMFGKFIIKYPKYMQSKRFICIKGRTYSYLYYIYLPMFIQFCL